MSIDIAPDVMNAIQRQLNLGAYSSPDELLREALARLSRRSKAVTPRVLAIQEGIDDMEAGRVMPLRNFDRKFRRRNNLPTAE